MNPCVTHGSDVDDEQDASQSCRSCHVPGAEGCYLSGGYCGPCDEELWCRDCEEDSYDEDEYEDNPYGAEWNEDEDEDDVEYDSSYECDDNCLCNDKEE